MPRSDSLSVGLRPTEEGLSSSPMDSPCIPRPLRRRVPGGCTSQGFTASVAFALRFRARLPLGRSGVGLCGCYSRRGRLRFMLRTAELLASLTRRGQRASTPGFRPSPPLSYLAAGSLPGPDLHRLAHRGFSGHTSETERNERSAIIFFLVLGKRRRRGIRAQPRLLILRYHSVFSSLSPAPAPPASGKGLQGTRTPGGRASACCPAGERREKSRAAPHAGRRLVVH